MSKIEKLIKDLNEEDELRRLFDKLIFMYKNIRDNLNNLK